MQKEFDRSISQLDNLFSYITVFTDQNKIGTNNKNVIYLAVEEIFTNMVKYNPETSSKIILELYRKDEQAIVTLTDHESQPFDLTKTKVYDLDQSLSDRPIGKLGLHLVKKMMDSVDYSHKNGTPIITLVKYLGD